MHHVSVDVAYDVEANVWFVEESSVPGLSIEADTFEHLCERIPGAVQDLLEEMGPPSRDTIVDLRARKSIPVRRLQAA